MLDEVGLVHMNGRVYDPALGRFVSADFMIPSADNSQAYNRYSYVFNNPLSLTDPDGQCPLCIVGLIVGTAAAEAITTSVVLQAIISGAVSGAIAGEGDPRAILQGAVSGALFGGAHALAEAGKINFVQKVAIHAVGGGAINKAFGGDFRSGALAAGFAALGGGALEKQGWEVGSTKYAVARTVMGGIAAELGGGKFANGAATAAFGYLMNECGATGACGREGGYDARDTIYTDEHLCTHAIGLTICIGPGALGSAARGASVGAMRRATFDEAVSASRHLPGLARPGAAAGPMNGQAALDVSLQVSASSTRRVGIDYVARQFVVFDEHAPGMFHGHVRSWADLTQAMQATLRRAGMADRRGNILHGK